MKTAAIIMQMSNMVSNRIRPISERGSLEEAGGATPNKLIHCNTQIYVYIYIYIERERDICICIYIYIYMHIYIYREREKDIISLRRLSLLDSTFLGNPLRT